MTDIITTSEESIEFVEIRRKYPTAIQVTKEQRAKLESHLHKLNAVKVHLDLVAKRAKALKDDRDEIEAVTRLRVRAIDGEILLTTEEAREISNKREKFSKEYKTLLNTILLDSGVDPSDMGEYAPVWDNDEVLTVAKVDKSKQR